VQTVKKAIRLAVIIIAAAVFVFYAYKLVSYLAFSEMNRQENEELVLAAVTVNTDFREPDDVGGPMSAPDGSLSDPNVTDSASLNGGAGSLPSSDAAESNTPNGGAGSLPSTDAAESSNPNGGAGSRPSSDGTERNTLNGNTGSDTSGKTGKNASEIRRSDTPVSVNFDVLRQKNEDVIAWLYQGNTQINYPIVQSYDNAYYLRRSFDRKYNVYGCLYLDYRCAADYSDNLSVVYGHEARNGSMFGSLAGYKKQEYYDTHKVMYLMTPDGNYRVRVFAGIIVRTDNRIFSIPATDEELAERIQEAIENSTFKSDVKVEEIGRVLMLSTCTYEFTDARYLVLGSLEKIENK
jgi:sortase B